MVEQDDGKLIQYEILLTKDKMCSAEVETLVTGLLFPSTFGFSFVECDM